MSENNLKDSIKELEDLANKYESLYPQKSSDNDIMDKGPKNLSSQQVKNIDLIKNIGNSFHEMLDLFPNTRGISLSKTKLEECVMWAVKGVCSD